MGNTKGNLFTFYVFYVSKQLNKIKTHAQTF
jgi:hypothetical protein